MTLLDPASIQDWHAHVYFGADSRDDASQLRETITSQFGPRVAVGRFHERPVGPHPEWSFQIAFSPSEMNAVVGWLALNRRGLDVLVHPNTGDELRDHRDSAMWIGHSHQLDLTALHD